MLTPGLVDVIPCFQPLGNRPAVSLTQSIPPNNKADILLLNCDNIANILFTNHVNNREMDITCCESQRAVIARNILLLTFIIDDMESDTLLAEDEDKLWNIYFHMYVDAETRAAIRDQGKKLHKLCETMDTWHKSTYGSRLRFGDVFTFNEVKKILKLYMSEEDVSKEIGDVTRRSEYTNQIRDEKVMSYNIIEMGGSRSIVPMSPYPSLMEIRHMHNFYSHCKSTEQDSTVIGTQDSVNPTFLTPEETLLHYATDPISAFHVCTAYMPLLPANPLGGRIFSASTLASVVMAAQAEFREWITSFQKYSHDIKIRFVVGDVISLAHTLQNMRTKQDNWANFYQSQNSVIPLILDGPDYTSNTAPLEFDVIEASNVNDRVGHLVLLTATSPLLRNNDTSVLHVGVHGGDHATYRDMLEYVLCGHVQTVSTLLNLFPHEYWTNMGSSSLGNDGFPDTLNKKKKKKSKRGKKSKGKGKKKHDNGAGYLPSIRGTGSKFMRISFKRPLCVPTSTEPYPDLLPIRFDENQLAKVFYDIFLRMLRPAKTKPKQAIRYTGAGFASFLNLVRTSVTCDWSATMKCLTKLFERHGTPGNGCYLHELYTHLHLMDLMPYEIRPTMGGTNCLTSREFWSSPFDEHSSETKADQKSKKQGSQETKKQSEEHADQSNIRTTDEMTCVTLSIPRKKLHVFTKGPLNKPGPLNSQCIIKNNGITSIFSACHLVWGDVVMKSKTYDGHSKVTIKGCPTGGWECHCSLIAMFYAPAHLLAVLDSSDISVGFAVKSAGKTVTIYEVNIKTSSSVSLTKYAPYQSDYPIASGFAPNTPPADAVDNAVSMTAIVSKKTGRIVKFTGRVDITSIDCKKTIKDTDLITTRASPCQITIHLEDTPAITFNFPVYIVKAKQSLRIERTKTSCFLELTVKVGGFSEWMSYPSSMYPIVLRHSQTDLSRIPTNWNMNYIDLEQCPIICLEQYRDPEHKDKEQYHKTGWILTHAAFTITKREHNLFKHPDLVQTEAQRSRLEFKQVFAYMLLEHTGIKGKHAPRIYSLTDPSTNGKLQILILGSTLRYNRADRSIVLDCAVIALNHKTITEDLKASIHEMDKTVPIIPLETSNHGLRFWRHLLAASIERCRTWSHHTKDCEYTHGIGAEAATIPLSVENNTAFLCSCGNGVFPDNFECDAPNWANLSPYAVRAAISPAFCAPVINDYVPRPKPDADDKSGDGPIGHKGAAAAEAEAAMIAIKAARKQVREALNEYEKQQNM